MDAEASRRDLASDVAFMNKMVDEIVAERRRNGDAAAEGTKDMLAAMMTGVDRSTGRPARRRQHPLPDQHFPDRGA